MSCLPSELPQHPFFNVKTEWLGEDERVALAYRRAKVIMQAYREFLHRYDTNRFDFNSSFINYPPKV